MPKTKILATIGPASSDHDVVKKMVRRGVSGFRVNCAIGSPHDWESYVKITREVSTELDTPVSLILDTPGPQLRSGDFGEFAVKRGDTVKIVYSATSAERGVIPVPVRELFNAIVEGDVILYGDGEASLRVTRVGELDAEMVVLNDALIKPRKKLVLKNKDVKIGFPTEKDKLVLEFASKVRATYVALSYITSADDLRLARNFLTRLGWNPGLIAKIETRTALSNLEKIVHEAEAVLIARGDLGLHLPLEVLPQVQMEIIEAATLTGKPSIVATEVLESMVENPRPSRSDVVDIYVIVNQLADAILLTNETAIGRYPVETIEWATRILEQAEQSIQLAQLSELRRKIRLEDLREKYAQGLVLFAESIGGTIVGYTKTGRLATLISRMKPQARVYMASANRHVLERLTLYYGITPIVLPQGIPEDVDYEKGVELAVTTLKSRDLLRPGDVVIKTYTKHAQEVHEIRVERVY